MSANKPYRLAVKAVIFDAQNRCLLIRRSAVCHHFVGKWEWPGGKPDPGEEFTTALAREVREETALEVEICGLAGATHFEIPAVHVVNLCMEARALGGQLRLSEEHDDFAWAPLKDLAQWPLQDPMKNFMLDYARRKTADWPA